MQVVWYWIVCAMLTTYVVLDGFDFGAGILHSFVARSDEERRTVLAAIGPLWDGNEVWLIASGGVLVFAFPRAYSAAFSGFYLPLMLVLWLLVVRGVAIEFRSQEPGPLWRAFWDTAFSLSSAVMALVLGAALGNVVRGVPTDGTGYFHVPFFTDFRLGAHPGTLDWYTVLVGLFSTLVLAGHGALYLAWKTSGPIQSRCVGFGRKVWPAILFAGLLVTLATSHAQPAFFAAMSDRPALWSFVPLVLAGAFAVFFGLYRNHELVAFGGSCGFIAALLLATAGTLFPKLLRSTIDPSFDLDVHNGAAAEGGLTIGIFFWVPALVLAIGYFAFLFHSFRGKVAIPGKNGHGGY